MGKRQIGEMQPYEVVITLIIADLATLPMSDTNIPLLNGILPLAILVLIHYSITLLTRKSIKLRLFLSGKPIVVISPNGIEYKNNCTPVTAQDMNIKNPPAKLPFVIISDGKLIKDNINKINLSEEKFKKILNKLNIKEIKNILIFTINDDGNVYYQIKNENFKIVNNIYKELDIWKF